jgi:predicted transcriptional regulator
MKTVILQIANLEEVKRRARNAFAGKRQGSRISFSTPELLFKLLTAKRWELIRSLCGTGPMTIREAALRVDRDVKAVHGDVHALLDAGLLQKTGEGRVVFPFDVIRIDVMLRAT